ncbi:MAG: sigma-70 family RNA polymerase sigma factor [Candidatus Uhrbacteria bacterium]|nr:sigma-70 family RNA polymerase sigma factor [Candidatus Uhrbacteria bacterium]
MDKHAFEQFYKANIDRIYRYVFFRVGRNVAVAEDLVSEVFMKALKNFHKFDPEISQSAWIYRIAHNHLANYFRDQKKSVDLEDVIFTLAGEDGRKTFETREDEMKLYKALDSLAPEDRRLVTMKYLDGYSYKEMAHMIEKRTDALKVATHRAMKKLKLCFSSSDN